MRSIIPILFASLILTLAASAETPPAELWVHEWNSPANHSDVALFSAFDSAGRMYMAGSTYEGGTGGNGQDFFLKQIDATGSEVWIRQYGDLHNEVPSCMLVTRTDRVVLAGYTRIGSQLAITLLCYDSSGTLIWNYSRPTFGSFPHNFGPQVVEDDSGALLVCAGLNDDFLVVKLSPAGNSLWEQTYDGPGALRDEPADLAIDAAGNVYVTGIVSDVGNTIGSYGTVKFDTHGAFQWAQFENGDLGSLFPFAGVEVAPDGDVVVVGNPESTCGTFQLRTWKLEAATGQVLWLNAFPSDPCNTMEPIGMEVDAAGNVVVAGFGWLGAGSGHLQTISYNPNGSLRWSRSFGAFGSFSDVATSLALDTLGYVYVAGCVALAQQNSDWEAVKYTPFGQEAWSLQYGGSGGFNDRPECIAVSVTGDILLVGRTYSLAQQSNAVAILYRQADMPSFCDPAHNNSSGNPAVMTGAFTSVGGSGLHLNVSGGPAPFQGIGQLGYILVGNRNDAPGIVPLNSNGNFCLVGSGGSFGRYNVAGTDRLSLGIFDAAGHMQNVSGTGGITGQGFDVPSTLEIAGFPSTTIMSGDTYHFQCWFRDTQSGVGRSNFSNGLSVTFP